MKTPAHVIRLNGPWQLEVASLFARRDDGLLVEETAQLPPTRTIQIPADRDSAVNAHFRGRVHLSRRFGCPTNLATTVAVILVLEGDRNLERAWLNQSLLRIGPADGRLLRIDIRPLLMPRNLLVLEFVVDDQPQPSGRSFDDAQLLNQAWLEIHAAT